MDKQLWIVEDDQDFVESIRFVLDNTSNIQVSRHFPTAEDFQSFLHSPMYNQAPDLILMDYQLPGMNGVEAILETKSKLGDIPIVMLTFLDKKDHIIEAIKAGAAGYIVKGEPFDKIINTINNAINGDLMMSEQVSSQLLGHIREEEPAENFNLTARQMNVLELMCEGLSKADIAQRLLITHATADNHFRHIYQKLGVRSAHAAVALAFRKGLVSAS